jgi:hypothetical protein
LRRRVRSVVFLFRDFQDCNRTDQVSPLETIFSVKSKHVRFPKGDCSIFDATLERASTRPLQSQTRHHGHRTAEGHLRREGRPRAGASPFPRSRRVPPPCAGRKPSRDDRAFREKRLSAMRHRRAGARAAGPPCALSASGLRPRRFTRPRMRFWPPVKPRDDVARVSDAPRPAPRRHRHDVDALAVPRTRKYFSRAFFSLASRPRGFHPTTRRSASTTDRLTFVSSFVFVTKHPATPLSSPSCTSHRCSRAA